MKFRSTRQKDATQGEVSFKEALLRCLPPDGGLYVPASSIDMRQFFLYMDAGTAYPELVATAAPALLQGELNPLSAARAAESDFAPELRQLDENFSLLFLDRGPTGVYKDFGVAFLAAIMEELLKDQGKAMIITAARDHAGVSLARAFGGRQGITSVILYPDGEVHGLNPASFVPHGGTIIPIQVRGCFDDCQALVNGIIRDASFAERHRVTSANTINVGRLLPQAFYYLYAFIKLKKSLVGDLVFSVPSGNFGNLIAGLYAWKFGMPVNGFIAAMNANNALGDYIRGREFVPREVIPTNSPALDMGCPSNFERLDSFYRESPSVMRNLVFPESVDDSATLETMEQVWKRYGVLLDPAGAVAFAAARRRTPCLEGGAHVVVLCPSHPARNPGLAARITGKAPEMPPRLMALRDPFEPIARIDPDLEALEGAIASCC
ncbi:MAG: threonine synthase [Treponema sp.]|jgi:threonine synthase|nr:threonine synthase [Treponema sp.]